MQYLSIHCEQDFRIELLYRWASSHQHSCNMMKHLVPKYNSRLVSYKHDAAGM